MMVTPFTEHPHRDTLVNELHSRAPDYIEAPSQISSFAILTGENPERAISHLGELCDRMSVPVPSASSNHFTLDLAGLTLRFEQHTEFCSYTLVRRSRTGELPFERMPLAGLPQDWLASMPGELVSGVHIVFEGRDESAISVEEIALRHFSSNTVIGAFVSGQAAVAYSDLRLHEDRFQRILLRDISSTPGQAGRTIQRLIEVWHYRALSLLALPLARKATPILRHIDDQLAEIAARMADPENDENESELLHQLSNVTAQAEAIATANSYRFGASRAYYRIVLDRLEGLRERRVDEMVSFSQFLERRLAPAMATCKSVEERTSDLSNRGARVASLLRARVEVDLQAQNKTLLERMNRRAYLQLRLQQAVEGLSVVAITYYMVGLFRYVIEALRGEGLLVGFSDTLIIGILVPLVFATVFFGLHHTKRSLGLEDED